jgi:hypothetical protein
LTFGVVCLVAAVSGQGGAATTLGAYIAAAVMIVFSLWAAWRRR